MMSGKRKENGTDKTAEANSSDAVLFYRLPKWELVLYILTFSSIIGCGVFDSVWISLYEKRRFTEFGSFEKGWKVFGGRLKDTTDGEWSITVKTMDSVLRFGAVHVVVSLATQFAALRPFRRVAVSLVGLAALFYMTNYRLTLYLLGQMSTSYLLTQLFNTTAFSWLICLVGFASTNFVTAAVHLFVPIAGRLSSVQMQFFVFAQCMNSIRMIGWAYETVHKRCAGWNNAVQISPLNRFINYMTYSFYYPTFFVGPYVTPRRFMREFLLISDDPDKNYRAEPVAWTLARVGRLGYRAVRLVFYYYLFEALMHFIYFYSWLNEPYLMRRVSSDLALGVTMAFLPGLFFQLKYIVIWGFPIALASVDGVNAPESPHCVIRIVKYSDMWRLFDVGLYQFLRDYIYVPLGGSQSSNWTKTLASLLCFLFVGYWHGFTVRMVTWVLLGFLVVFVESSVPKIQPLRQLFQKLSLPWQRRLLGVAVTLSMFTSVISLVFFFSTGLDALKVYVDRLVFKRPSMLVVVALMYYSQVQMSLEREAYLHTSRRKVVANDSDKKTR